MIAALTILSLEGFLIWLVFFKKHWLKFGYGWGLVSFYGGLHVLLVFLLGMRYGQPYSTDARIVRHTIQLTPRLPEPTVLEAVLVDPNQPVSKGDTLFQFDRSLYEYRVQQAEAALADATQRVSILEANVMVAEQAIAKARAELNYAAAQEGRYRDLAATGAGREDEYERWQDEVAIREADLRLAEARLREARLEYEAEYDGVHTMVVSARADLEQARYYLDQTTFVAPENGYIVNLQAVPGMVAGIVRVGAIATLVVDDEPYLLAPYVQEHLKHVKPGQSVEVALDLYPGRILNGTVEAVWWANADGQLLPSGRLPEFPLAPSAPQRFAVKIRMTAADSLRLPAGAQGVAAIYTDELKQYQFLRRVEIRGRTVLNYLFPMPF